MTIICIIGNSGSGKSTIAAEMETFGIKQIVSYTTRPMREGEVNGIGHFFVTEPLAEHLLMSYRPLAYTLFGGFRYFALFRNLSLPYNNANIVSYVIDEKGYLNMQDNLGELYRVMQSEYGYDKIEPIHLLPIYIDRPDTGNVDAHRTMRDIERIDLPADTYKLRIVNDAPDLPSLRRWSKDFAEAICAYLSVRNAGSIACAREPIFTSQSGVANIIASLNNAVICQPQ